VRSGGLVLLNFFVNLADSGDGGLIARKLPKFPVCARASYSARPDIGYGDEWRHAKIATI
jgi:hypothetical protein